MLGFSYILVNLFRRIKAVEDVPSDGEIIAVRDGLGKLAAIHHAGLVTVASLALVQIGFCLHSWKAMSRCRWATLMPKE